MLYETLYPLSFIVATWKIAGARKILILRPEMVSVNGLGFFEIRRYAVTSKTLTRVLEDGYRFTAFFVRASRTTRIIYFCVAYKGSHVISLCCEKKLK